MIGKRVLKCISTLVFIFILLIPFDVDAKKNPYRTYWQLIEGTYVSNCIYVAWDEAKRHTGVELPYWGRAGRKEETSWLPKAEKAGFKIGKEPRANSIAVYEGHVAYVLSVSKNGKKMVTNQGGVYDRKVDKDTGEVTIKPKNGTGTVFNYEVSTKIGPKSWGNLELYGFIYLDVVPDFVVTTTVAGESVPEYPTTTTKEPTTTQSTTTSEKVVFATTDRSSIKITKMTTRKKQSVITQINEKKDKISFYRAVCTMLALLILGLLIITTYVYKMKENR